MRSDARKRQAADEQGDRLTRAAGHVQAFLDQRAQMRGLDAQMIQGANHAWLMVDDLRTLLAAARRADEDGLRAEVERWREAFHRAGADASEALDRADRAAAERDQLRADIEALAVDVEKRGRQINPDDLRAVLACHPADQTGAADA